MTTSTIPTQIHPRPHGLTRALAAAGAALALAAATAFAVWQTAGVREGTAPNLAEPAGTAAIVSAEPLEADAPPAEIAVFVVGSEAEADRVTGTLAEANRLAGQFGRPTLNAQVVVAATPEQDLAIQRAQADTDAYRAALGLPPLVVTDLRGR